MSTGEPVLNPFSREELLSAVATFGSPLYAYHLPHVVRRYNELSTAFDCPLQCLYAMKANSNRTILDVLRKEGSGIDAVSLGEVRRALEVGFSPEQIMYTTNAASADELKEAASLGVVINIDGLDVLKRLAENCPGTRVCLRINPDVRAGAHEYIQTAGDDSKFGFILSELEVARAIAVRGELRIVGLHKHTGSGIYALDDFREAAEQLFLLADPDQYPDLEFLDVGGGFGVAYEQGAKSFDIQSFADFGAAKIKETSDRYGRTLRLVIEPGKFLVAESGVLLMTVLARKEREGKLLAITDSGFHHLIRPMLYQAHHEILNLFADSSRAVRATEVCGRVCESGDVFASERRLPEPQCDDILAVCTAGAYGFTMASDYNLHGVPKEVCFDGSEFYEA